MQARSASSRRCRSTDPPGFLLSNSQRRARQRPFAHRVIVQRHAADVALGHVCAEFELQLGVDQLIALQHLAQAAPLVPRLVARPWLAEGQQVVVICTGMDGGRQAASNIDQGTTPNEVVAVQCRHARLHKLSRQGRTTSVDP